MSSADVVVVGGGIIGAACAESLARESMKVVLLERFGLAAGASGACQGGVGIGLFMEDYDLQLHSAAMVAYRDLVASGVEVDYRPVGELLICSPDQEAETRARLEHARDMGVAAEWLEQAQLQIAEPGLSPSITGAALLQDVACVSPMKVVSVFARRATQLGAEVCTNTVLTGIEMARGRVIAALTTNGRIVTERIIIAAGSWSSRVGEFVGLRVPVWPLKGHILVTEPMPGMVRHMITEMSYEASVEALRSVSMGADGPQSRPPEVAAVLESQAAGQVLVGSSREFAGFDREVDRGRIAEIARKACQLVPDLSRLRIIRTYAGLRPWTPDGRPMIGPTRQAEGIVFATGHAGAGITLAPLTGRLIAQLLTGTAPLLDTEPLSPDRFVMC